MKEKRKKEIEEGVRATIPVDLLWQVMPVAVKEKLTTRQLIMIISAVLIRCDVPLDKFSLSLRTAQRYKKNTVQKIGSDALETLAEKAKEGDFPLLAHFDEKILTHDFEGKKESAGRMVTTLTLPYLEHDQLVNAAAMKDGSGFQSASEVFMGLAGLDVLDQVIGVVADTTNSNFGQEEGAMQHLQRMMDKPILEIPCTHHTEELPAKDVQEAVSGRKSSGPTDPLFVKWSNAWNTVKEAFEQSIDFEFKKFNWEEKEGSVTEAIAKLVMEWARKAKKEKKFSRGDYDNALNYLLAFGGVPVDFNMARPCRVSKARFLQLALYYLQIYLLLDLPEVQELLTAEEVSVMAEYCALHYIPWMLQAKFAASAPRNLLTAIERLRAYREDNYQVATIALKKRENHHLNFLSPELAVFALFDEQVPSMKRQAMASQLLSLQGLWEPGERLIYQLSVPGHHTFCTSEEYWLDGRPTFHNFINGRSFLLWEALRKNHQDLDWLALPVSQWKTNQNYVEINFIVNNLSVVNDPAERMIRLVTERITTVRSEEMLQETLLTVSELQRLAKDFRRGTFTKKQLSDVIKKMLKINE